MRKHRVALIVIGFTALAAAFIPVVTGSAVSPHKELVPSESSVIHATPPMKTPLLTTQSLEPIAVYAQDVANYQAAQAAAAAASLASSSASQSPSPSTTTAPAGCGARPDGDYALDATTVDTPDWCCIRVHEDGNTYDVHQSGAYGFEPETAESYFGTDDARGVAPATQDAAALDLFARNHDHFLGTWNGSTEACGLT